jgi:hypothetical protein
MRSFVFLGLIKLFTIALVFLSPFLLDKLTTLAKKSSQSDQKEKE